MTYLVTGAVGLMSAFITQRFCQQRHDVINFGNLYDY
jgi:nucleoside-diphosphate-sugar epimerase